MSLWRTLEGRIGEMCELPHTRTPGIASHYVFSCCLRGEGMNNLSQPPQPTEPDMATSYTGSLELALDMLGLTLTQSTPNSSASHSARRLCKSVSSAAAIRRLFQLYGFELRG